MPSFLRSITISCIAREGLGALWKPVKCIHDAIATAAVVVLQTALYAFQPDALAIDRHWMPRKPVVPSRLPARFTGGRPAHRPSLRP